MQSLTPPAVVSITESQWVEGELARSLMHAQRDTQLIALVLIAVVVGVLWRAAPHAGLIAWAAAAGAEAAARFFINRKYMREVAGHGPAEHLAFLRRYRLAWPLSALIWGSMTWLHFDRAPLTDQFVCWLIIAGLGMFAINSLSGHLAILRAYLDTLALTVLAFISWHVVADMHLQAPFFQWWVVALMLIFWQALRRAGLRLHRTHRQNFELQYRNNQLIESLKRQTEAALEAVATKNRFLASAAHDIRQPVHALSLYADWLGSEPELVHELAPKIVESTKAVNQLFDSLFDLARLDSGKIKLNIEPVDLAKLLRDLELQYRPLAQAKGLRFRIRSCQATAVSDPILLRRIVGNLISNAIRYTQRGGVLVAARVTACGERRIEVWDTGVGIASAHQREIFREFYKVPTHAGTEEGFGLGLYIVARLTQILGHPLSLASRPARGTVFRLVLQPTDAQAAAQRAQATVAQLASNP